MNVINRTLKTFGLIYTENKEVIWWVVGLVLFILASYFVGSNLDATDSPKLGICDRIGFGAILNMIVILLGVLTIFVLCLLVDYLKSIYARTSNTTDIAVPNECHTCKEMDPGEMAYIEHICNIEHLVPQNTNYTGVSNG